MLQFYKRCSRDACWICASIDEIITLVAGSVFRSEKIPIDDLVYLDVVFRVIQIRGYNNRLTPYAGKVKNTYQVLPSRGIQKHRVTAIIIIITTNHRVLCPFTSRIILNSKHCRTETHVTRS